jgi:hypothetical protein
MDMMVEIIFKEENSALILFTVGGGDDVLSGVEGADYFDSGEGRDNIDDFEPIEGDFAMANCIILVNVGKPAAAMH